MRILTANSYRHCAAIGQFPRGVTHFAPRKRPDIVTETADYLLKHHGPDDEGRGHPTRLRLRAVDLGAALDIAKKKGLNRAWRIYHFPNTVDMWARPEDRQTVILGKFDHVLRNVYRGNLIRLIQNTNNEEMLRTPFVDTVDGKPRLVNLVMIYNAPDIAWSVFRFVRYAVALKMDAETRIAKKKFLKEILRDLKPEHMARSCRGTWDGATQDRVLMAKFEQVLHGQRYRGDILKMVVSTSTEELLLSPLIETLAGKKVQVKMGPVYKNPRIATSVLRFIRRYLDLKIPLEKQPKARALLEAIRSQLRPEHLAEAAKHTWDETTKRRVLIAKVKAVMHEQGVSHPSALLAEKKIARLVFSPLIETVAGTPVEVSMSSIFMDPRIAKSSKKALRFFARIAPDFRGKN